MLTKFRKFFTNKYFITLLIFAAWMLFFDDKDITLMAGRQQKLNDLRQSEQKLEKEIAATRVELNQLKTNASSIERYAREKYLMKKDNEEIFVLKGGE